MVNGLANWVGLGNLEIEIFTAIIISNFVILSNITIKFQGKIDDDRINFTANNLISSLHSYQTETAQIYSEILFSKVSLSVLSICSYVFTLGMVC